MRHFLLSLSIMLCPAVPAFAQVTVDLHALDGLPSAPEATSRQPPPSLREVPGAPVTAAQPGTRAKHSGVAARHGSKSHARTAAAPPAAAPPPGTPAPAVAAAAPSAAQAAAGAGPRATGPQSAGPRATAAQSAASPPPPATLSAAPPAVASITPIQPPAPPANAAPPPAPPIVAGAATTGSATPDGLRLTFAGGQSDLSPGSADLIKHLVQGAPAGDATTFNVLAYAAGDPDDPSAARRLSLARAIAVRAALMADGVASSRIYLRALGSEPGHGPADRVDVGVLGVNASAATGQR